ncbi:PLDc N-terminal domain-containing protein [Cellulomonas sp. zg-ZUI222]|uniref:PLDc N-terminal domain-containing protein n=1 Tax=Cellulomonas wangleii TaxID=2816956 RepID=A0ABX8D648_9CELL|nr:MULTISPECIES: PLDc N-terminal domain-containing protein [Cellulomonas]MBO0899564.1 PLDc N-terminal domain-containing protein [Cellulomonas sp. zg-ZUI22]MBO0920427.1 PLDc N-terminal domain-containing protein [Cellulomonas wangleii]MBO0923155.1 PLDc N-terminal domain-containing protein [Cellulomonas wangleii]QVI61532.1 PLDc N-terminal domain-containing protein [Cellulomonas wangleii]
MLRYLPIVIVVALSVYCVFDVLGSDERRRRGLSRHLWLLVVLVPLVGAVAWLLAGRGSSQGGVARRGTGPVAPDDDPEFLFRLDQERRRRQQERDARGDGDGGKGADDAPGARGGDAPDDGDGTADGTGPAASDDAPSA